MHQGIFELVLGMALAGQVKFAFGEVIVQIDPTSGLRHREQVGQHV